MNVNNKETLKAHRKWNHGKQTSKNPKMHTHLTKGAGLKRSPKCYNIRNIETMMSNAIAVTSFHKLVQCNNNSNKTKVSKK